MGNYNVEISQLARNVSVADTSQFIGIGITDPSQKLEVYGNLSLVGKIIAGNRNHLNLNFDNLLDFNAETGITAFRPINFIDTSATIKIARVTDNLGNDSAVEFQTWNSDITLNTSYWDIYGGYYGMALRDRFPGRVKNRLFVGTGGNVLIGSTQGGAQDSALEISANGPSNILQVQGDTYISGKVHIGSNESTDIALQADGNVRVGFSSTTNYIAFHGTYLDGSLDPGVDEKNFHLYTHSFIAERVYDDLYRNNNPSSDPNLRVGQKAELLIFKGNDPFPFTPPVREPGADRIRLAAAEVHIDTYSHPIPSEDLRTVDAAATHDNLYQRLVVTGPGDVGIGTTLPTARVHIARNTTPGADISTVGDLGLKVDGNVIVDGNFESDVTISTGNSITGSGIGLTGTIDAPDGTYGSSSAALQITVADGRISNVSTVTMTTGVTNIGEVIIHDNDVSVGTAGTINFGSNLTASPASLGISTISVSGSLFSYDQATNQLQQSTGTNVTLPLAGTGNNQDGLLSHEDKTKLDGIAQGAEVNVQANWTAITGDSFIQNKPTLGTAAATNSTDYATAAQGALADNSTQIISTNTTFYVSNTVGDDNNDGLSSSSQWETIQKAADYLSVRRIKNGVRCTVLIAAGTYTSSVPLNLDHPQGESIVYRGATPSGTKPVGTALKGSSGTAIRGYTSASQLYNNGLLQAYYNTTLQFNSCSGIVIGPNASVCLQNILLRGNFAKDQKYGVLLRSDAGPFKGSGGTVSLSNCAIHNFGNAGLYLVFGGFANLANVTITNCGGGILNASGIVLGDQSDSALGAQSQPPLTISNCDGEGLVTLRSAAERINFCLIANNKGRGIESRESSSTRAEKCTIDNNGREGVSIENGGSVLIRNSTVTKNGFGNPNKLRAPLRAAINSSIDFRATGSTGGDPNTTTFSGNATAPSPPFGASGNDDAIIVI